MMDEEAAIKCLACNEPAVVEDTNDEDSIVSCPKCKKEFGKWGTIKKAALDQTRQDLQERLLAPFKNSKHWKLTKK